MKNCAATRCTEYIQTVNTPNLKMEGVSMTKVKEKVKVYTYTRVSTAMQVDGYSLDAQKSRMKAYAEFNDYEIVGDYEDAGKSGKSIEGRTDFNRMMEDIKTGKDDVSFVLVFKLSRFGRNALVISPKSLTGDLHKFYAMANRAYRKLDDEQGNKDDMT